MRKHDKVSAEAFRESVPPSCQRIFNGETGSAHLYTLITGAGAGIGRALALASAKKRQNLILVSLPGENLAALSKSIEAQYQVKTKFLEIDLTEDNAPLRVRQWCIKHGLAVNRLINNAGMINRANFEENSHRSYESMLRLNISAVVVLTRLFLPELKKHNSSSILNLGSMACFLPVPYKTTYAATKAFILSFSLGLREELRKSPVRVHILCPGSVPTNQEIRKRMASDGWFSRISVLTADKVAEIALHKMERRKPIIIPGWMNRIYLTVGNLMPKTLKARIMARVFRTGHTNSAAENIPVPQGSWPVKPTREF